MNYPFFELIQIAIGKREAFSEAPSLEEWEHLFDEAQRQTLVGVLYDALDKLPTEQRPPKRILIQWHALTEKIVSDNERVNRDAVWVTQRFLKAGFRNAILKGQGNALLYPNPLHRQSGDIDIWLDGGRDDIINYVLKFFPKQRVQWLEVSFPVRKETVIEVHTAPNILFCPGDNKRLQTFFREHKEECFNNEAQLPDGSIYTPTWEMNVIFQLTHIYRHLFFEGIGLRQLMDYYYLLQSPPTELSDNTLINYIRSKIEELHLKRFTGAVMWVLKELFLIEDNYMIAVPNEKEGKFLLNEIMLAGNFGKHDSRNKLKKTYWGNFWQITHRNLRFLTHYPREVVWNPWYRIRQFLWRKRNGYE